MIDMNDDSDFRVLAVEIKYITAAIDEMRREDIPGLRDEIRQAIRDEVIPLELRISRLETELRIIDKRVWVMFGAAALVVPTLIGALIAAGFAYFTSGVI